MNVKELKKLLEGVSDNALVVVEGRDHNYLYAYPREELAIKEDDMLFQSFDETGIPVLLFA